MKAPLFIFLCLNWIEILRIPGKRSQPSSAIMIDHFCCETFHISFPPSRQPYHVREYDSS